MTWIKICGITNLEDARMAVDAGADALGFVFYEKSPRKVETETVHEIVTKLPEHVQKVGVFAEPDIERVRDVVSKTGLTVVQLHGKCAKRVWNDPRAAMECVGAVKLILAIPGNSLKGDVLINQPAHDKIFAVLLDAQSNGVPGGTGMTFDWEATRGMVQSLGLLVPVIVAGGLTALNVAKAINLFQPFGVDVASGVEARPGKKDPDKVRAFIEAVRNLDRKAQ
jgi:phosphoribosylanthranilate isomerase